MFSCQAFIRFFFKKRLCENFKSYINNHQRLKSTLFYQTLDTLLLCEWRCLAALSAIQIEPIACLARYLTVLQGKSEKQSPFIVLRGIDPQPYIHLIIETQKCISWCLNMLTPVPVFESKFWSECWTLELYPWFFFLRFIYQCLVIWQFYRSPTSAGPMNKIQC